MDFHSFINKVFDKGVRNYRNVQQPVQTVVAADALSTGGPADTTYPASQDTPSLLFRYSDDSNSAGGRECMIDS